ncbi:MAG: MATE family efflux transporter [Oscillospiraceae bacterium]|nr:MATE family efflux transporter [Oscillospiraceae bacterium]
MAEKKMENQFWKYVLTAMPTILLDIVAIIVDGFFVGRAVGDAGLAAVNLAWPAAAVVYAVSKGIGAGGSVVMSTRRGAGDEEGAERARGNTIALLVLTAVVMTALLTVFLRPILRFLGAEGEIMELAWDYSYVIALGCSTYVLSTGLAPLLRNRGKTMAAMYAVTASILTNIVLDAVLTITIPWGVFGAGLATVIAGGVSSVICIGVILCDRREWLRRKDLRLEGKTVWSILKIGASPMGLFLSPSLVIVFSNWQCLRYGGDMAVAVYSVLSYLAGACQSLLQGVGEGVQPIISYCRGASDHDAVRRTLRRAAALTAGMTGAAMLFVLLFRGSLPAMFGTSAQAGEMICHAALYVAAALPFLGAARLLSSYFYAVDEARVATVMAYADPVLATPVFLFGLPLMGLGLEGVWMAYPAAQIALALMAMGLLHRYHRRVAA